MLRTLAAAEKVARYRHAQLSAVRLSGDPNARPENVNLEPCAVPGIVGHKPQSEMKLGKPRGKRKKSPKRRD